MLDQLLEAVLAGESRVLVVHGEPGAGKSALLEYLAGRAGSFRVLRVAGVQSEMELAFAGLHQMCASLLGRLGVLPGPQRKALRTAFGLSEGPAPDRFLVGLAVLGLLSEVAGESPVLCLVDDAQWLDRASAQVLAFVARRLGAESVGLVFGTRVAGGELAELPELAVGGLAEADARVLLDAVLTGPVDARVRDEIVAETRGNPLALLELPRGLSVAELAGGFGLPGALPLAGRIEDSFRRQIEALPAQTRRLLLVAAADPTGDPALMWRAAGRLGIRTQAAAPAAEAGLAEFGGRVRFRHPLARSAVYRSASELDRREAHRVLAEATAAAADPDRQAWHRAQAAAGPDEDVAAELERSAGRAQARGGLAAAAAFLERATLLTADPARRAGRTLAAAQASLQAGAFGRALELLAMAEAGPLDELQGARADLLRGQIAFASGPGSDAPMLLLKAARRLEPLNPGLARETYLDAWGRQCSPGTWRSAATCWRFPARPAPARAAGDRRGRSTCCWTVSRCWSPTGRPPRHRYCGRPPSAFASADIPAEKIFRWGWMAGLPTKLCGTTKAGVYLRRHIQLARDVGALDQLPFLLGVLALDAVLRGDFAAAASLITEADAVSKATGSHIAPYAAMVLAASVGREAEAAPLIQGTIEEAQPRGQGAAVTWAHWMAAILYNGLGRYEEALAAARQASEHPPCAHLHVGAA